MLGSLKMVDFLNVFVASEEDDAELNYSVIDSKDDFNNPSGSSFFFYAEKFKSCKQIF